MRQTSRLFRLNHASSGFGLGAYDECYMASADKRIAELKLMIREHRR